MSEDCYRCRRPHPTDGTSCSVAQVERAHAQADLARSILTTIAATNCATHKVPIALCAECTSKRVEAAKKAATAGDEAR